MTIETGIRPTGAAAAGVDVERIAAYEAARRRGTDWLLSLQNRDGSLGNPADGYQVIQAVRSTGGTGAAVTDEQIIHAIRLLAETEGIFTEPAGGTTLAATIELVRRGAIPRDESIVVCVTGNGYKTAEVVANRLTEPVRLSRSFKDFEAWHEARQAIA